MQFTRKRSILSKVIEVLLLVSLAGTLAAWTSDAGLLDRLCRHARIEVCRDNQLSPFAPRT